MTEENSTRATGVSELSNRPANRRLAAGFASALLPGVGQLFTGRRVRGFIQLSIFVVCVSTYLLIRLPGKTAGILVWLGIVWILCLWTTVDASYGSAKVAEKPSQWWLLALSPVAVVGIAIHANWPRVLAGFKVYSSATSSMAPTINLDDPVCSGLPVLSAA
jgi:TM2 domain-containing membrane protein YozV